MSIIASAPDDLLVLSIQPKSFTFSSLKNSGNERWICRRRRRRRRLPARVQIAPIPLERRQVQIDGPEPQSNHPREDQVERYRRCSHCRLLSLSHKPSRRQQWRIVLRLPHYGMERPIVGARQSLVRGRSTAVTPRVRNVTPINGYSNDGALPSSAIWVTKGRSCEAADAVDVSPLNS